MRYDEERGVYRDCKWCGGKGCLSCPSEADKAYKAAFPDGPKPVFEITRAELDRAEIEETTGGATVEATHGALGALVRDVLSMLPPRQ